MNGKSNKSKLERLLVEFANGLIAQNEAIRKNNPEKGNQYAGRYIRASAELISLGETGISAFATLLTDSRVEVRTMAACELLPYRTKEALAVLEESAKGTGVTALGALMTLKRWKSGGRFLASAASTPNKSRRASHKTDRSRGCCEAAKSRRNACKHRTAAHERVSRRGDRSQGLFRLEKSSSGVV